VKGDIISLETADVFGMNWQCLLMVGKLQNCNFSAGMDVIHELTCLIRRVSCR